MKKGEIRRHVTTAGFQIREDAGKVGIRGYAAVFDSESHREVVLPGAFDKTLAEGDDVRFLVNHEGVPLARTKSGTMRLSVDDRGLLTEVDDLDMSNPTVAELVSAMGRGDIDQMSFAFTTVRQNIIYDDEGYFARRELAEVKLWDTSVVTYPWYEDTEAELNAFDQALVALRSGNPLDEAQQRLITEYSRPVNRDDETRAAIRARQRELLARRYAA